MEGSSWNSRRSFLKRSTYAGVGIIGLKPYGISALPADEKRTLRIIHTNDMHSHIDPFPDDDPRYPGQGGMAERAYMIDRLRSDVDRVLLLDAGDIFQGTPYFNYFGGSLELELMSQMGYDAATMGNHDFDGGMDGFEKALEKCDFPFLCSNYDFTDTILEGRTDDHRVFKRSGMRIGVFGLGIRLKGLVDSRLCAGVRYLDPITVAREQVKQLKEERKCDLVICLSHLGYAYEIDQVSDRIIAEQVDGIDLIIGGHTHTFLDHPVAIEKQESDITYINQVGWAGVRLGVLDFELALDNRVKGKVMHSLDVRDKA
ncbi:MAG: bifunctional metallophosphatase/5'-nucleotidase [Flavobacteriales bacterium]|nr:bifunctional metallophosphatase/5'-nucleotidase [Flavobacteriales bacterium]